MNLIVDWVRNHQTLFATLAALSAALLVLSMVVFPLVVIHLPADYFMPQRRSPAREARRHPVAWLALTVLKNAAGLALILAGLAMLVLPGQGVLTILVGLALTNFPGKFRAERALISRRAVHRPLNRIRELAGRPPLEIGGAAGPS
ncbi:MAG: hypothetical protein MUC56_10120 [Thermoanaerobaculales bacterium]|jgi:purine-cytosine permease-like protein|nr:hypothetical protein [Thermoanaerobaculales bacterium]